MVGAKTGGLPLLQRPWGQTTPIKTHPPPPPPPPPAPKRVITIGAVTGAVADLSVRERDLILLSVSKVVTSSRRQLGLLCLMSHASCSDLDMNALPLQQLRCLHTCIGEVSSGPTAHHHDRHPTGTAPHLHTVRSGSSCGWRKVQGFESPPPPPSQHPSLPLKGGWANPCGVAATAWGPQNQTRPASCGA